MLNARAVGHNMAPKDEKWFPHICELEASLPAGTIDHSAESIYEEVSPDFSFIFYHNLRVSSSLLISSFPSAASMGRISCGSQEPIRNRNPGSGRQIPQRKLAVSLPRSAHLLSFSKSSDDQGPGPSWDRSVVLLFRRWGCWYCGRLVPGEYHGLWSWVLRLLPSAKKHFVEL